MVEITDIYMQGTKADGKIPRKQNSDLIFSLAIELTTCRISIGSSAIKSTTRSALFAPANHVRWSWCERLALVLKGSREQVSGR